MIVFKGFEARDAEEMDWIESEDYYNMSSIDPATFQNLEMSGQARTMINTDTNSILGIIICEGFNNGMTHVTMHMSRDIQTEFSVEIFKALQKIVDYLMLGTRRLFLEGKASNLKLDKLVRRLGFQQEGVMRCFGWNGEDYNLYSIVR